MAFLINNIFKREVESYPERAKSFFIRDILSTAEETADVIAHSGVTTEDTHLLTARSTKSFGASRPSRRFSPTLDRHQFHAVSLYDPSPAHRHHQQLSASLTATIQQPPTTFLLPTADGSTYIIFVSQF